MEEVECLKDRKLKSDFQLKNKDITFILDKA